MNIESHELQMLSDQLVKAVEKAAAFTVLVNSRRRMPASGVIYSAEFILTADHVLEREEDLSVILADGNQLSASIAGRDTIRDLALLRLGEALSAPAIPAIAPAKVGQLVLALGRPDSNGVQASLGVISAIGGPVRVGRSGILEEYIRTDCVPYPGFSGGPLVDVVGQLIGINSSAFSAGTLLTIPTRLAHQAADSLAEFGAIRRGYLGIRSQTVNLNDFQRQVLGRHQETGLLLVSIEDASPAANAGLMTGDILVGFESSPVMDHDELQKHLGSSQVGSTVTVEILRGDKRMTIGVTIGERK